MKNIYIVQLSIVLLFSITSANAQLIGDVCSNPVVEDLCSNSPLQDIVSAM